MKKNGTNTTVLDSLSNKKLLLLKLMTMGINVIIKDSLVNN